MLDLHDQKAREVGRYPFLKGCVRLLLLDAIVAFEMKAIGIHRLEIRIRRFGAKLGDILGKVPVKDHQRIVRLGMRVKALGQQHVRAEIHVAPPEPGEQLTANPDVLDEFGVGLCRSGRYFLVQRKLERFRVRRVYVQRRGL